MNAPLASSGPRPTVLLVESDRELQTLIRLALRKSYDVVVAADEREAMDRLAAQADRIEAVLLDLGSSSAGACTALAQAVRTASRGKPVPLIATGCLPRREEMRVMASGCDSYLSKPFYPRDLLSLLEHYAPTRRI